MSYGLYYTLAINIVVGQLPSINLNIPRSLFDGQSYTMGLLAHKRLKCIPGVNNLTLDSSHTRNGMLQSNPSLLTPGPHFNTRTLK